jgi:formylglycine-generating enzyme required for sulfatase activity
VDWYRRTRARTKSLFDIAAPDAYYDRPIALRNPIVFYEGHLPAFAVNTLVKLCLGRKGIDDGMEVLFARGIDPADEAAVGDPSDLWPVREAVQAYAAAAEELVTRAILDAAPEAVCTIIEHELMHQETLLYMFHNLPYGKKGWSTAGFQPAPVPPRPAGSRRYSVEIPPGRATLGAPRGSHFGWDNEFPELVVEVPSFAIDAYPVTNGDYLEFMTATLAKAPHFWVRENGEWLWRGMFATAPLDLATPVYVSHDEAEAYARWKGCSLPTEAEYHRAAFGTPEGEERLYPWGDEPPDASRGNFDFASFDPVPTGSHPEGVSAWGVHDLAGNGWEWTATVFAGFPGFEPMRLYKEYSADFFDDAHYVMKGASPVTPRELVRPSFRNWFRPAYPYVFAKFRCARSLH